MKKIDKAADDISSLEEGARLINTIASGSSESLEYTNGIYKKMAIEKMKVLCKELHELHDKIAPEDYRLGRKQDEMEQYGLYVAENHPSVGIIEYKTDSNLEFKMFNSELKLLENEAFKMTTDFESFNTYMKNWLLDKANLKQDILLLWLIRKANDETFEIDASTIARTNNLSDRLEFCLAGLLEEGKCKVFDKKKKTIIKIEVKKYDVHPGPLVGEGGRIFLADGIEFFRIIDWES